MDAVVFNKADGVEYDPLYNEILLTLSDYDNSTNPLDNYGNNELIDWRSLSEKCEWLLTACKDLRVMMWHLRATLHIHGVIGLFQSIRRIDEALASGEMLYPQMSDEAIGSGHSAALGWLATASCLVEIKMSRLTTDGTLTLDTLQRALQQGSAAELGYAEIVVILEQSVVWFQEQGCPSLVHQCLFVVEALERIEQYVNQYSDGYLLECRNLRALLSTISAQLTTLGQQTPEFELGEEPEGLANMGSGREFRQIRSRQEAILLINSIIAYFKTYEPSHPAPIFMRRAQKLIGMEFEDIIEELMPDARGGLETFIGRSD